MGIFQHQLLTVGAISSTKEEFVRDDSDAPARRDGLLLVGMSAPKRRMEPVVVARCSVSILTGLLSAAGRRTAPGVAASVAPDRAVVSSSVSLS